MNLNSHRHLIYLILLMASAKSFGQTDLSEYNNIEGIYIISHWGNIDISGDQSVQAPVFNIEATFTDTSKTPIVPDNFSEYVSLTEKDQKLYIETREPMGFESIDLNLKIPNQLFIEILLYKGGNIFAENCKNGIEINSLNGSVKLEGIGEYALVSATNGEIEVEFDKIDKNKPISLVTLNGGVTAILPENARHNVRLISRKNGYVNSDFNIETDEPIINLNQKKYAKKPIMNTGKISGGGSLLFLSTENGPITLKKSK